MTGTEREQRFKKCVRVLMCLPNFTKAETEGAAEFLKSEAAQQRHFWLRFGTSGGNYIAATLPILTLVMLMDTTTPALLTGVTSSILLVTVFAIGAQLDPIQDLFQAAESMLKSAAKQAEDPNQEDLEVPINTKVESLLRATQRRMIWTAAIGIILAAVVAWLISVFLP